MHVTKQDVTYAELDPEEIYQAIAQYVGKSLSDTPEFAGKRLMIGGKWMLHALVPKGQPDPIVNVVSFIAEVTVEEKV
jgi:hypothetical protein